MSTVAPPGSSKTESTRIVYYYPNQPLRTNLNHTISTISSYVPEMNPFSWVKIPLEWFRSLINSIFRFFEKASTKNAETKKPLKPQKNSVPTPPKQDLGDMVVLQTIFEETKQALDQGFYLLPDKTKVCLNLESMKKSTKVWTHDDLNAATDLTGLPTYKTTFETLDSDTIVAGLKLLDEGLKPLLLNMANRYSPGGGVTRGCLAQEEELCRKSALYVSINPPDNPHIAGQMGKHYLIPEHGCIYTAHVPVIRDRKDGYFTWIASPRELSFVSSAAYDCRPKSTQYNPTGKDFEDGMRLKIRSQIRCALKHGHDSLVLGAYGCGAFMQDPKQVSTWYMEELAPYQQYFKKICFAVLVARPSDQANYDSFHALFS
jgi:uncharacterized protein (TIGR02452 family)